MEIKLSNGEISELLGAVAVMAAIPFLLERWEKC